MNSNSHNFKNNRLVKLILVPNSIEFPVVSKNALNNDQKYIGSEVIATYVGVVYSACYPQKFGPLTR